MQATPDHWELLLQAMGSLALVLAAIFGLAFVAKKYFQPQKWVKNLNRFRVIQSLPLGLKSKLVLVEVENKKILLGVGNQQIQNLAEWEILDSTENMQERRVNEH